jgi:NADH dehydrogenase/NADH:ubiquinone oxidoreductase subunit G
MTEPVTITIDGQEVASRPGQTVLAAARTLGIDIPALCYLEKCGPLNSCLVCVVKINGRLVPSCGTQVEPGMVVESESEEVHAARRTALELLFSDHVGDCLSPCQRLCPL